MSFDVIPDRDNRYEALDQQLDTLHALIQDPKIEDALGLERTHRLREQANNLLVPNFDGQRLTVPREYRNPTDIEKLLPVFALKPDETIWSYDPIFATMQSSQIDNARHHLGQRGLSLHKQDSILADANAELYSSRTIPLHIYPGRIAEVRSYNSYQDLGIMRPKFNIFGRPFMLLNADSEVGLETFSTAALHELLHVDQQITTPIHEGNLWNREMNGEFDAYYSQHLANIALGLESGRWTKAVYDFVEGQGGLDTLPLSLTPHLRKSLKKDIASRAFPPII